ncbi:MAG: UvrD-helicase domain-containing protein [Bernardetiaceae bacterium]|nr:UvrD-helicase domain-containing protein [Bernardetiaceae bacterium]
MVARFLVYRSSAGSGKTFTLTKEFVKLALVGPASSHHFSAGYYRRILAVTFTRDAAAEMKKRVVGSLDQLRQLRPGESYSLLDDFLLPEIPLEYPDFATTTDLRAQLVDRAGQVFDHLLHNYSELAISTIDAFTNRVVQSFAKDLDLPFNYEIEMDTERLLDEAIAQLLNRAGEKQDPYLTAWLREFMQNQAQDEQNWHIEGQLRKFGSTLFNDDRKPHLARLAQLRPADFRAARDQLNAHHARFRQYVSGLAQQALQLLEQQGIGFSDLANGKSGIGNAYFKKLAELDPDKLVDGPTKTVIENVEKNKWEATKISPEVKVAIVQIAPQLAQLYHQLEDYRQTHLATYLLAGYARQPLYLLGLASQLQQEVDKLLRDKNRVMLSEFNHRINQIVENEPVPYLYERIGEQFRHLLIDEFQDTSQMQWHNLLPLLANGLASNQASMVVGDAKQSIYRWRGGNAEMIVHLPQVPTVDADSPLAQETTVLGQHYQARQLAVNFRSLPQIVQFNNQFFDFVLAQVPEPMADLGQFYARHAQTARHEKGGHVELSLLGGPDKISGSKYQQLTFERCLRLIGQLTQQQGYQLSDIAILCRRNVEAAYLAQQLLAHDIRVISSESLLIKNSPAVRFIVGFLRVMTQPVNHLLKSELLYFLYRHLKGEGAQGRFQAATHQAVAPASRDNSLKNFFDFLAENFGKTLVFRKLQYLSLYETAEELVRVFELNTLPDEQIYVQRLLDEVVDFGQTRSNNLSDFLAHWDRQADKLSVTTPKTGNAVQLVTIHKAKGLQFPVVIVPYADWALAPNARERVWVNWEGNRLAPTLPTLLLPIKQELANPHFAGQYPELAQVYHRETTASFIDAVNILYVALTRPEEKLYLLTKHEPKPGAELKSVGQLLANYAEAYASDSRTDDLGQHWVLQADEGPKLAKAGDNAPAEYRLPQFISTECRDKIRMRRDDTGQGAAKISIDKLYEAQKQGNLLHFAFEKVRTELDIERAAQKLVFAGLIGPGELPGLVAQMRAVVALPQLAPYFQAAPGRRILLERELLVKAGTGTETQRPDRVVLDPDLLTIIDYKTGDEQPSHREQVTRYARAWQQMPPYRHLPVQKLVVYTQLLKVVTVP